MGYNKYVTRMQAEATVTNINRQTISSSTSFIVHPSKYYMGVKSAKMMMTKLTKIAFGKS